jgi:hypothetical protein
MNFNPFILKPAKILGAIKKQVKFKKNVYNFHKIKLPLYIYSKCVKTEETNKNIS